MTALQRAPGTADRLMAAVLLLCLLALGPLAHASPPDPTWIAGIYDDADYDDVVLAITSSVGTIAAATVPTGEPLDVVLEVLLARSDSPAVTTFVAAPQTRAPPST